MLFQMLQQQLGIGNLLIACRALENMVGFDVVFEGCARVHGFAAASISNIRVDIHVGLQGVGTDEGLGAGGALEQLLFGMDPMVPF